MFKAINLKNITTKAFLSTLAAGSLLAIPGANEAVASTNGVQGLELRYLDSGLNCGAGGSVINAQVEVYDQSDELLATMSKYDTFRSTDIDSVSDLKFQYVLTDTDCAGTYKTDETMLLGPNDTIPNYAAFSNQSSITNMLAGLDSYEELFLVELGGSDKSSATYDLQDIVLVVDNNPVIPKLWGIDEDDGQLFSMGDYTNNTTMTDYGKLKWNDNGTIKNINADMEAMTLDENGDMYIALDRKLSGTGNGATLLKFNIDDASTTANNVVQVIGEIGISFDNDNDNVSGLSIDPNTGQLVALLRNNGGSATDKLYIISKSDGSVVSEIGDIQGLDAASTNAEDIEHAPDGTLYVTDNADDHTYKVNPLTGAIIQIVDNNQKGGLGSGSAKFEALGWDFAHDRLIGFDDDRESLAMLTLKNGDNQEYYQTRSMGLTDVEGVDFVPTIDGEPRPLTNYAPVAKPDEAEVLVSASVTIDALLNDSDVNGDTLTISSVDDVTGGTADIVDNKVVFSPGDVPGKYTFQYTITDNDATDPKTATANITVEVFGYAD